jgi:dTDP-4-dehydrorhamnose reductase
MKIFVTGGAGRMGGVLLPLLAQHGWHITAPRSTQLNITDETAVARALELAQPEVVLHLAAYTDVVRAEREPERAWAVNVLGTRNLARHTLGRFVHFSTDYVFDGERGMYLETDIPHPANFYSLTKTVGEEAARHARRALIVRTSFKDSVWPYPVAFEDQFTSADFVDVIANEMLTLINHLGMVDHDLLHVVTERKSIFELARRRNPDVQSGSRLRANVHIPPDVSLDVSRWLALKDRISSSKASF